MWVSHDCHMVFLWAKTWLVSYPFLIIWPRHVSRCVTYNHPDTSCDDPSYVMWPLSNIMWQPLIIISCLSLSHSASPTYPQNTEVTLSLVLIMGMGPTVLQARSKPRELWPESPQRASWTVTDQMYLSERAPWKTSTPSARRPLGRDREASPGLWMP